MSVSEDRPSTPQMISVRGMANIGRDAGSSDEPGRCRVCQQRRRIERAAAGGYEVLAGPLLTLRLAPIGTRRVY